LKCNCEIKEIIISIIYNIIKNEKFIVEKENRYNEIINKYKILKYLILMIKEENNNKKVILCCLRILLFISNNSYEEIIRYEEKIVIEILDEIFKSELNNVCILFKTNNKEEFEKYSETVYLNNFLLLLFIFLIIK
jgi:ABC-type iron transport system FetAB permease component